MHVYVWSYATFILEPAHERSHEQTTSVRKVANKKAREDRAVARDYQRNKVERINNWLRYVIQLKKKSWHWTKCRESNTYRK
jgi:hypothetical protein